MDWDMKTSSWDWDNLMLYSGRETTYNGEQKNNYPDTQVPVSVSANHSDRVEEDLYRNKMEGDDDRRNVGFLGLRNQVGSRDSQEGTRDSSNNRGNGNLGKADHHAVKQSLFVPEQHQRSCVGPGSKTGGNVEDDGTKQNGALTVVDVLRGSGDSHIGLKLGKRTYFEDASCGGAVKAAGTQVSVFPGSSVPPKKPRALAQGVQTPRCQVEGCKTELTNAKDYHRRHKVCEAHSKSPKVTVAGLEQRFCQQCSRFHELKEFDEGKRSCRRRLDGHNKRRRKPQPDAMALNSARLTSTFHDNRHSSFLMDRSFFVHPRIVSSSMLDNTSDFKLGHGKRTWPRIIKTEDQSTYNGHLPILGIDQHSSGSSLSRNSAEKMLLFLQSSKNMPGNVLNHGIPHFMQSSGSPVGQALTLSSSSGTGVISGLEVTSATQRLSGVSDSGSALSLLSSQSWGSRSSGSASLDMATRSGVTLEQLMHENQPPMAQPLMQGLQHNFDLVENKLLTIGSQSPVNLVSSGFSVSGRSSIDKERHSGALVTNIGGIGNFEGHMLGLLQGHGFRGSESSQDVRCTIDLMRRSSNTQTNESQGQPGIVQQGSDQFTEFQSLKSYESSVFDSQQMM